jgi:hypothetical protein
MEFLSYIPWYAWVAIVSIVGWILITLVTTIVGGRKDAEKKVIDALDSNAAANRALTERLDQLDKRLASVEKTLNDIP